MNLLVRAIVALVLCFFVTAPILVWIGMHPTEQPAPIVKISEPAYKRLHPELIPICACESTGNKQGIPRQYGQDGKPLLGVLNPSDIGMCQINRHYHQAEADQLGIKLETEDGNVAFANILHAREGTKPWNWSRSCWGK